MTEIADSRVATTLNRTQTVEALSGHGVCTVEVGDLDMTIVYCGCGWGWPSCLPPWDRTQVEDEPVDDDDDDDTDEVDEDYLEHIVNVLFGDVPSTNEFT